MTRLRVRVGRWLTSESYGVDQGDLDEANELFRLAVERLGIWAETDRDPEDFVRAYDVGTLCAFISAGLHLTTRSVLSDVIATVLDSDDVDPVTAVRLHELVAYYYDLEHLTELPEVDS